MIGMSTPSTVNAISPESVLGSFIGKTVVIEYHGNKEATGILQGLGGGIAFLQQLDGRTTVVMMGSIIRITEATRMQH